MIFTDKRFKVLAVKEGIVVIRRHGSYTQHAHFEELKTARIVIKLINNNVVPESSYLIESIRRLLTVKEFIRFIEGKAELGIDGKYYCIKKKKGKTDDYCS